MLGRARSTAVLFTSIATAAEAALSSPPFHGGAGTHLCCWVLGIGKRESRIPFSVERGDDFSTLTAVPIR